MYTKMIDLPGVRNKDLVGFLIAYFHPLVGAFSEASLAENGFYGLAFSRGLLRVHNGHAMLTDEGKRIAFGEQGFLYQFLTASEVYIRYSELKRHPYYDKALAEGLIEQSGKKVILTERGGEKKEYFFGPSAEKTVDRSSRSPTVLQKRRCVVIPRSLLKGRYVQKD